MNDSRPDSMEEFTIKTKLLVPTIILYFLSFKNILLKIKIDYISKLKYLKRQLGTCVLHYEKKCDPFLKWPM